MHLSGVEAMKYAAFPIQLMTRGKHDGIIGVIISRNLALFLGHRRDRLCLTIQQHFFLVHEAYCFLGTSILHFNHYMLQQN
jgi:hypothetical protein